jgi:mannose-6-phosphate isomerase-like protein (cupin superfamily)
VTVAGHPPEQNAAQSEPTATETEGPEVSQSPVEMTDDGEAVWHFGGLALIKLSAADTDGRVALLDELMPQGTEAWLHVHSREDETFCVLEGQVTFTRGDGQIVARPGSVVHMPRGTPHAFRVDSARARFLSFITPAGLEEAIRILGTPAEGRVLPPPEIGRPELGRMRDVLENFGIEIVA